MLVVCGQHFEKHCSNSFYKGEKTLTLREDTSIQKIMDIQKNQVK